MFRSNHNLKNGEKQKEGDKKVVKKVLNKPKRKNRKLFDDSKLNILTKAANKRENDRKERVKEAANLVSAFVHFSIDFSQI